jgi:hypothetical protein
MLQVASAPFHSARQPQWNTVAQKLMKKTEVATAEARKIQLFCDRDDGRP